MPTVTLNDINISYTLHPPTTPPSSPKPPLVLINGLADTKETWSTQLPAFLAASYTVLAFDNRGIGESSRPTDTPYTAEMMADDTKALVDELGIQKPFHLVGVSMGGMIAQTYALKYGDDLASLCLACTYAKPNTFCTRMFNFWAEVAGKMGVGTVMKDVCAWGFTPGFFEPEHAEGLREFDDAMAAMDEDLKVKEYLCQLNVIQKFDSTDEARRLGEGNLKGKVMVVAGEEDILIPVKLSRELRDLIPSSEWKEVQGGHCCLWEFPDSFNEVMVEWLDRVSR